MRKQLFGVVISNKMDKTVTVRVERLTRHLMYKKYVKRYNKYMAHDIDNSCLLGDKVLIKESRPISKNKRWYISKIVKKVV